MLEGLVVDKQARGHTVARYSREIYLGCVWKERAELGTDRFLDTVLGYINTMEDPAKRSKYPLALTELQSQKTGLSVPGFASDPSSRDCALTISARDRYASDHLLGDPGDDSDADTRRLARQKSRRGSYAAGTGFF